MLAAAAPPYGADKRAERAMSARYDNKNSSERATRAFGGRQNSTLEVKWWEAKLFKITLAKPGHICLSSINQDDTEHRSLESGDSVRVCLVGLCRSSCCFPGSRSRSIRAHCRVTLLLLLRMIRVKVSHYPWSNWGP